MKCPIETQENAEWLLEYSAGKLDAGRTAIFEDHVRTCHACRKFAEGQRAVLSALDSWEAPPVSPDFDRRLYQRIETEVRWWDLMMRPFRPLLFRQGLPIAATAALVLAAGLIWQQPPKISPSALPQSAQVQVESMPREQVEHALDEMDLMREFNRLVRPDTGEPRM